MQVRPFAFGSETLAPENSRFLAGVSLGLGLAPGHALTSGCYHTVKTNPQAAVRGLSLLIS